MEILEIIIFLSAICNFLLGFFVFLKNPSKQLNRFFGISCFCASIWIFSNFMMGVKQSLFWLKNTSAFGVLLPFTSLLWVSELCERKLTRREIFLVSSAGLFFFIISYINSLIVANVKKVFLGGFEGNRGPFFIPFWIYIIGVLIAIIYILLSRYFQVTGIKKLQINYVIIGGILFISTVVIASFILPIFGIKKFMPIDSPSSFFLLFFTTLAITRYHLFGIRIVLTELFIGLMAIILGVLPFLMPTKNLKFLTSFLFFLFLIFAYYLIKAVHEEERRREEAQVLAIREKILRKKAEKLANELERLNRAKDQFILSIQHHLRTPLTPVIGYLSMILEGSYGEISNQKIKEKLIAMQNSVNVLHRLIENLLDITQLRVGKKILNLEKVKLEDLIEDVVNELMPQAVQKGLKIEFEKKFLPQMMLDKMRMREAIFNILDNSIKYTQKGKVKIDLKVENSNCLIEIQDTGIGMTKEEIENFLKGPLFERGVEAKKMWGPGKGIGLTVALEFVKAHGGQISIFSEGRGKGTKFVIKLPIK